MEEDKQTPQVTEEPVLKAPVTEEPKAKWYKNKKVIIGAVVLALILLGGTIFALTRNSDDEETTNLSQSQSEDEEEAHEHAEVDLTKLPLGTDKYSTSAKQGYVYSCQTSYNGGGASTLGPWIDQTNSTWDLTKKISVDGDVAWPAAYWTVGDGGETRTISSADLPLGHNTGTFPIGSSDEAYQYDRNPNSIAKQTVSFSVPKNPVRLASPGCVGGEVGIATTGVLIFNAFDAGGRDAVAVEIQDSCEGHPQAGSYYHYHGYSSCFKDNTNENSHSDLLGYAFDGFGIYGLKDQDGHELTSAELDECHGHTHEIDWDGSKQEMYHYHFTQDFPYTVSCFRGKTLTTKVSSGEGGGQSAGGNQQPPSQKPGTGLPPQ